HLRAQRVVLLLPLVQEMAKIQKDQAVDVRLDLELGLETAQAEDEDEAVALEEELFQGPLPRLPALRAIDAEVRRRALPEAPPLQLGAQGRAQSRPERLQPLRIQAPSLTQQAHVVRENP